MSKPSYCRSALGRPGWALEGPSGAVLVNDVTFVYDGCASRPASVKVVGSFGDLFAPRRPVSHPLG
ncbi:MAG: hypothetical protein ACRDS9_08860 [Pseudonocardiaceae bacterium]